MLNHICIIGRLTRDPEKRTTQSGKSVTTVTLAVERDRKNESGERDTDFIDVVAFGATADFVCKYFSKGTQAAASGRLQSRKWQDKDGNKRVSWEIVADSFYFAQAASGNRKSEESAGAPAFTELPESEQDGELPF